MSADAATASLDEVEVDSYSARNNNINQDFIAKHKLVLHNILQIYLSILLLVF